MKRCLEKSYPYITPILVVLFVITRKTEAYKVIRLEFILNSAITFPSTYIGFVITAITIFLGLAQKPLMKFLKEKNLLNLIVEYFMASIVTGTLLIVCSLYLGCIVDDKCMVPKIGICMFIMTFFSFLLCLIRVASFMTKIFIIIQYEENILKNKEVEKIDADKLFNDNINSK